MKNLRSIVMQEQADLELVHPKTSDGLGAFIILAGPEHPDRRRYELDKDRKIRQQINKKGSVELEEPEVDYDRLTDYLGTCTLGWYTLERDEATGEEKRVDAIDLGSGPVPFSMAAARAMYVDKDLAWIRPQVRQTLSKNDLFIKDSSRSSSNTAAGSPDSPKR